MLVLFIIISSYKNLNSNKDLKILLKLYKNSICFYLTTMNSHFDCRIKWMWIFSCKKAHKIYFHCKRKSCIKCIMQLYKFILCTLSNFPTNFCALALPLQHQVHINAIRESTFHSTLKFTRVLQKVALLKWKVAALKMRSKTIKPSAARIDPYINLHARGLE